MKTARAIIGSLLGKEKEAAAYVDYFDRTLARVSAISQSLAGTGNAGALFPAGDDQPAASHCGVVDPAGGPSRNGRAQHVDGEID
ncbi:hypothetical protein [Mesorhizobium sp. M0778]|uniref:hypothetical protein n=1 Tax=Mesorhizobium sp. M0778 TaxID=2956999 RepID=UPI003337CAB2